MTVRPERGSVLPLTAAIVVVAVVFSMVLVELGAVAVERAEAQTAADLAALAAVHEGRSGAADLAARNGATLLAFAEHGDVVRVEVQVGRRRAEAWAELDVRSTPILGGT